MCESWNLKTTACVSRGVESMCELVIFLKPEASVRACDHTHVQCTLYSYLVASVAHHHQRLKVFKLLVVESIGQPDGVQLDLPRPPMDNIVKMDARHR